MKLFQAAEWGLSKNEKNDNLKIFYTKFSPVEAVDLVFMKTLLQQRCVSSDLCTSGSGWQSQEHVGAELFFWIEQLKQDQVN